MDEGLTFLRKHCREDIPTVDQNLVVSLCFLFEALLKDPSTTFDGDEPAIAEFIDKMFFFSFVWSLGGNIDSNSVVSSTSYSYFVF